MNDLETGVPLMDMAEITAARTAAASGAWAPNGWSRAAIVAGNPGVGAVDAAFARVVLERSK